MRKIVYYVATSIDGFISGLNDDVSGFIHQGKVVQKYLSDLSAFDTVIMGRNTYEYGYKYGLKPGEIAYQNMTHFIFSDTLEFAEQSPNLHIKKLQIEEIQQLKQQSGTDIYLCGGGQFAGWLLDNEQIDILKIKLNPLILGTGVRLFGNSGKTCKTELLEKEAYDDGLQLITYKILY